MPPSSPIDSLHSPSLNGFPRLSCLQIALPYARSTVLLIQQFFRRRFLDRSEVSRRFPYIPTPKGVFYSGGIGTPRRVQPPHPGVPHRTSAKRPYLAALIGRPEP